MSIIIVHVTFEVFEIFSFSFGFFLSLLISSIAAQILKYMKKRWVRKCKGREDKAIIFS